MAEHADHDAGTSHEHGELERVTSPMQDFGTSEVGLGIAVLVVGLVLTFGLALLLA